MLVSDPAKSLDVVKALADSYSRKILFSTISKSSSIEEISQQMHIPISTCYRKMQSLESSGMMRRDKTIIDDHGKKLVLYLSILKNATINFGSEEEISVEVSLNGNLEL